MEGTDHIDEFGFALRNTFVSKVVEGQCAFTTQHFFFSFFLFLSCVQPWMWYVFPFCLDRVDDIISDIYLDDIVRHI